jgi:5'-3' exonuclease
MSEGRPILVIDGLNVFYRHWAANPSMDANGEHVGGIVGFLKGVQLLCERYRPNDVIVTWESGGSQRRRAVDSSYKGGRKPAKLNRFYDEIPNTVENRNSQVSLLVSLLRKAGIKQIYVPDCEGDDVVAYLTGAVYRNNDCVIISTDKDFFQLIDSRVKVWSPGSKKEWSILTVIERFGIHPENFCLAKCFAGDASDSIKGVPGVGFKSLAKRFPSLSLEGSLDINDIITECKKLQVQRPLKLYDNIIKHEDQIRKNWKLMYLGHGKLAASQVEKINYMIQQKPQRDKLGFIKALLRLQISGVDYDRLFMTLKTLK